jgi:hypothetical protein
MDERGPRAGGAFETSTTPTVVRSSSDFDAKQSVDLRNRRLSVVAAGGEFFETERVIENTRK